MPNDFVLLKCDQTLEPTQDRNRVRWSLKVLRNHAVPLRSNKTLLFKSVKRNQMRKHIRYKRFTGELSILSLTIGLTWKIEATNSTFLGIWCWFSFVFLLSTSYPSSLLHFRQSSSTHIRYMRYKRKYCVRETKIGKNCFAVNGSRT